MQNRTGILSWMIFFLWIHGASALEKVPSKKQRVVMPATVAGQFYPASEATLKTTLDELLKQAPDLSLNGELKALLVPHAGYIFSGPVAARGYKLVGSGFKRVVIIASNHNSNVPDFKLSTTEVDYYETPLGEVEVSSIARKLLGNKFFSYVKEAHTTHIIEIQLPFLQTVLGNFEMLPIITGRISMKELKKAASLIASHLDDQTLLIISSDLSHYHTYDKAVKLDMSCLQDVEAGDAKKVKECEACGLEAILMLLEISKMRKWKTKLVDYRNSGDTAGARDSVVGYGTIAFYKEKKVAKINLKFKKSIQSTEDRSITEKDRKALLVFSRSVLNAHFDGKPLPVPEKVKGSGQIRSKRGCFVTLKKDHQLRGCIGNIQPEKSLVQCVFENTLNAALHDSRFSPVEKVELKNMEIEISVLSVPEVFKGAKEKFFGFLEPHTHGVILKRGWNQATYLPQVWQSLGEKNDFLSSLCQKGGMSEDCWKQTDTEALTYQATHFKESEF